MLCLRLRGVDWDMLCRTGLEELFLLRSDDDKCAGEDWAMGSPVVMDKIFLISISSASETFANAADSAGRILGVLDSVGWLEQLMAKISLISSSVESAKATVSEGRMLGGL